MVDSIRNSKERRAFQRFRSSEEKPAYVAIRPAFVKIGKLKDVSRSGIGFKYALTDEHGPLTGTDVPVSIDLFVANNGFYLPGLNCRLAYDRVSPGSPSDVQAMQFRECGLKFNFEKLTEEKRERIQVFLEHFTAGEA